MNMLHNGLKWLSAKQKKQEFSLPFLCEMLVLPSFEPADMVWMTRSLLEQYVSTASGYGSPYIVFPESVFDLDTSLYVKLRIPFPDNWRF